MKLSKIFLILGGCMVAYVVFGYLIISSFYSPYCNSSGICHNITHIPYPYVGLVGILEEPMIPLFFGGIMLLLAGIVMFVRNKMKSRKTRDVLE